MNLNKNRNKIEYFSCRKAMPVMFRFRLSLLKYILRRKKYPLFRIRSADGGLIDTYQIQKRLKLNKFVKHNGHFYFSLNVPHWPSRAYDNMVAKGGLNMTAAGTPVKKQIDTVILGITRKCSYECSHCYERFNLSDSDTVPVEKWKQVISDLQNFGVSIITLSGGEPMMRYEEVLEILRSSDHSRSDFHIHTSGFGVTSERAEELKNAGLQAAGIGLDDSNPERNDSLRGFNGAYQQAVNAIRYFQEAGIFTYINMCLTKELIGSGDLPAYMEMLKKLNIGIVRWLEPKPCGGYSGKDSAELLGSGDRKILRDFYEKANSSHEFNEYPLISYEAYYEDPENMGCMMAGNSQMYVDTLGNILPCVFLPVSFGNVLNGNVTEILEKMRMAVPRPLKTLCPAVQLSPSIKSRMDSGILSPVPYEDLFNEFESLKIKLCLDQVNSVNHI